MLQAGGLLVHRIAMFRDVKPKIYFIFINSETAVPYCSILMLTPHHDNSSDTG